MQKNGKDLNSDQLEAISKYDAVIAHLDFAKELSKHLTTLAIDSAKNIKKQARKEALERAQQELARTKDILIIQVCKTFFTTIASRNLDQLCLLERAVKMLVVIGS